MEERSKEEVERGIGAILAIESFLSSMRQYYKELEKEVDMAESCFDTGLLTGYRHAIEMMEDRAAIYGVFQDEED